MISSGSVSSPKYFCPDLRREWKLGKSKVSQQYVLRKREGQRTLPLSEIEGFVLQYFTGSYSVKRVQRLCEQKFGEKISSNFVVDLLAKLEKLGVVGEVEDQGEQVSCKNANPHQSSLKPEVQWFFHPDGHWIMRNGSDLTFLQVNGVGKAVTDDLGKISLNEIAVKHSLSSGELQQHLKLLAATGMLVGTKPQKAKKGKFTPFDLLFFLWPLFNPDTWLSRHLGKVQWLFTPIFAWGLLALLAYSAVVGLSQKEAIAVFGMKLWQGSGGSFILPFIILSLLVVSLHELAHAFTLKHYGGIVPEMGVIFMCLFPAAYTDTTDSYCLVKRRQRVLVVAAGVLCQLTIATFALGVWNLTVPGSWLYTGSYLLLMAALFTVAVNLNPLAKFDGYYLAVAATGINNLRSRSFLFYPKLLTGQPIEEKPRDAAILALYAPLSLTYLWLVFGFLFSRLGDWILTNIPFLSLTLLVLWGIYYFFPAE
ncbi:MAG: M50 family metallopeptidase [Symploca sp. SIO2E6]|nr:M50 family metallopeptidase [Symploca sp. SIO2E6]